MSTPKTEYNCFDVVVFFRTWNIKDRLKYVKLKTERVINNYHLQNYQIKKKRRANIAQGNEKAKDEEEKTVKSCTTTPTIVEISQ